MYQLFLLGLLFFQLPTEDDYHKMVTPEARLARAEAVIANKQKSVEEAQAAKVEWERQIGARTKEGESLIEQVKAANHMGADWSWDSKTHHLVQKK
jgi:hypothetical protein